MTKEEALKIFRAVEICGNCCHNINIQKQDKKYDMVNCYCEIHDCYLSYEQIIEGWCSRWAKEKEQEI